MEIKPGGGPLLAAGSIPSKGIAQIQDSATYGPIADQPAIEDLILQAANYERPYLRLTGNWVLDSGANQDARLLLDGLWIGSSIASEVILRGDFEEVILRHVTLDPGDLRTEDTSSDAIPAIALVVEGHVECLKIDSCITGRIQTRNKGLNKGVIESLIIQNSIVQAQPATPTALEIGSGEVTLERVTVLGEIDVHRLWATETLVTDTVNVTDNQTGCFRFSAAPKNSQLPRPYESYEITDDKHLFTSQRFGHPAYAQLSSTAPEELRRGAENGSEIGAFSSLLNPIKIDSLRAKVDE